MSKRIKPAKGNPPKQKPIAPPNTSVFVASVNNTGVVNEYVKNAFFNTGFVLGWLRIQSTSQTFDEHPISVARNAAVKAMLESKAKFTHIFFIDSDVIVPAHTIINLLQANKDIVSGWYLSRKGTGLPVVMKREGDFNGWMNKENFNTYRAYKSLEFNSLDPEPKTDLLKVSAIGAGCLLIKREVFKKLTPPYFHESHTKFHDFGEDLWFCENAKKAGFGIYVDRRILCGHVGTHIYDINDYKIMLQAEITTLERNALRNPPPKQKKRKKKS